MIHLLCAVGLTLSAVGQWPDESGVLQPLRCPVSGEYGPVTKLPQGCSAQVPCACYALDEHVRVVGAVGGLRAEAKALRKAAGECGEKSKLQARDVKLLRDDLRDAHDENARLVVRLTQIPEPPSRLVWAGIGAGGAVAMFLVIRYGLP